MRGPGEQTLKQASAPPRDGRLPIMIDLKKAMLDPTMVFKDPKDVVANVELTRDQKIEILRRWEYDARQLEVAEEEAGMAAARPPPMQAVSRRSPATAPSASVC